MKTAKRERVGLLLKKVSSDQTTMKEVTAQTTDRPRSASPRRRHFHSHSVIIIGIFRAGRLLGQLPPMSPVYSTGDIYNYIRPYTYHAVTEAPVVGRVAWPGGDGNRTRNLQIAGRETGSPDHSAILPPAASMIDDCDVLSDVV